MSYIVRLDVFEGPFDLLVYLIEHARMSVYDIRISEITAQYLEYVSDMKNARFELAQEFMVLAAELIDIKSRMLIPSETVDPETGEPEDPRKALVQRILEYKRFKSAAAMLQEREELMQHVRFKPQEDLSAWTGEEDELLKSSTEQFVAAFEAFLIRRRRLDEMRRTYERARRDKQSIEERSVQIRSMLEGRRSMMFSEMIESDPSVYGRVITFISLLELLRDGMIDAEQKERYSDIKVIPKEASADGIALEGAEASSVIAAEGVQADEGSVPEGAETGESNAPNGAYSAEAGENSAPESAKTGEGSAPDGAEPGEGSAPNGAETDGVGKAARGAADAEEDK